MPRKVATELDGRLMGNGNRSKWYSMNFNGAILERGFWLYVWDIKGQGKRCLYVGRTGDSSSAHASSPFRRIGQHLDNRSNAKANAMHRRLLQAGFTPSRCSFQMIAIGPIFPEQTDYDRHKVYRDRISSLESQLADHLRNRNFVVLGQHGKTRGRKEPASEIIRIIDERIRAS